MPRPNMESHDYAESLSLPRPPSMMPMALHVPDSERRQIVSIVYTLGWVLLAIVGVILALSIL